MGKKIRFKFSKEDKEALRYHVRNLEPFEKRYTEGKRKGEFMYVTQRMSLDQAQRVGLCKDGKITGPDGENIEMDPKLLYDIPVAYVTQDPYEYHLKALEKIGIYPITPEILDEVTRAYIKEHDESVEALRLLAKRETNPNNDK